MIGCVLPKVHMKFMTLGSMFAIVCVAMVLIRIDMNYNIYYLKRYIDHNKLHWHGNISNDKVQTNREILEN